MAHTKMPYLSGRGLAEESALLPLRHLRVQRPFKGYQQVHRAPSAILRSGNAVVDHDAQKVSFTESALLNRRVQEAGTLARETPAVLPRGRQGELVPHMLVEGPDAWYAADYADPEKFIYTLTDRDLQEIDAAVQQVERRGLDVKDVTKDDFPLPTLGPKLEGFREEARAGRGFVLIRGFPVWEYSKEKTVLVYWAFGTYWGNARANNKKGHLVGHIKDIGHDPKNPETRLYATHAAQPWHNDAADLVSLLCLSNAEEGGLSSWSSSIAVHNEILKRRPDLADTLAAPIWYFDRKGEIPEGKLPYFELPVFNYYQGYLSVNFSDNYYIGSQRFADVPRLTEAQFQAMDLFNQLAASPELKISYMLQPGDIQLLSNHTILHHREAFRNGTDPDHQRHLLRLWVAPPNDRPLPEKYAEIYGGTLEVGNRGGILVPEEKLYITVDAEG
eukprot:jgi/Botrbrau1/16422/Bobra.0142s0021.1